MDASLHVIDSEGDLLLLVEDRLGLLQVRIYRAGPKLGASTPLSTPGTLASSESLPDEKANALASISDDSDIESDTFTLLSRHNDEEPRVLKLRALISSKHLTLASHFFRVKLNAMLDLGGCDVLPVYSSDINALLILLNVLHCQTRKVPRFLTHNMLFMVAALAHHYQCVEALEAFSEVWIEKLREEVPEKCKANDKEDLTKWIFVAWIFRDLDLLKLTTAIAVRESTGPMSCLASVIIPDNIISSIEKARLKSIEYLVAIFYRRLESNPYYGCCNDCDRLIVGMLVLRLQLHGLYPRPTHPYTGYSEGKLIKFVESLPKPQCNTLIHSTNGCKLNCVLLPEFGHAFVKILKTMEMPLAEFPLRAN